MLISTSRLDELNLTSYRDAKSRPVRSVFNSIDAILKENNVPSSAIRSGSSYQAGTMQGCENFFADFLSDLINGCFAFQDPNGSFQSAIESYPLLDLGGGVRFTSVPRKLSGTGLKAYLSLDRNYGQLAKDERFEEFRQEDLKSTDPEMIVSCLEIDMVTGLEVIGRIGEHFNIFASNIDNSIIGDETGKRVADLIPQIVPVGGFCVLYNASSISRHVTGRFVNICDELDPKDESVVWAQVGKERNKDDVFEAVRLR